VTSGKEIHDPQDAEELHRLQYAVGAHSG
jgi:hypothetical protein